MKKILVIAWREFLATAMTRGFLVGILLPPAIMTVALTLLPILMNQKPPSVAGHIAVIDQSGVVAPRLQEAFSEEKMKQRRSEKVEQAVKEGMDKIGLEGKAAEDAKKQAQGQFNQGMSNAAIPGLPTLSVEVLDPKADVEEAKKPIMTATGREQASGGGKSRLALLVVPADAVTPHAEGADKYARYDLFVAQRLDPEVQGDIRDQAARAIVDARLEADGLNVARVRGLIERPQSVTKAVTKEGERATSEAAAILVPGAFMILLWISVFSAGQYLLAGTIEEKSNRVMEVLLSAVSPMQLMLGKILGKGAVGAVILGLYGGAGIAALLAFAMTHLIAWQSLIYLFVFFFIAYFTIACMMAAVGAAVTEVSEAQSLMGPIMMVLVIPMMLWMPILRNPNSMFAQVCSFVPLINPFVMVLRISGAEPIPVWQIPAAMAVGLATVAFMAWAAAKIFRIGVLMYGKPPNFATLVRWVRMA
jgi:ABC-type Na+ efflux pump permease subunit